MTTSLEKGSTSTSAIKDIRPVAPRADSNKGQLRDFCSQIDMIIVAIDDTITTSESKKTEITPKKNNVSAEAQTNLDRLREQNNVKRKLHIDELNKRASSTSDVEAIKNFVSLFAFRILLRRFARYGGARPRPTPGYDPSYQRYRSPFCSGSAGRSLGRGHSPPTP